jgi:hypothetical protein
VAGHHPNAHYEPTPLDFLLSQMFNYNFGEPQSQPQAGQGQAPMWQPAMMAGMHPQVQVHEQEHIQAQGQGQA